MDALGMPKDPLHDPREFLELSQRTDSKPFQVIGPLDHASPDVVPLRVVPCLLDWIELRRIPRQKE